MTTIRCTIPITVRVVGRPNESDLDRLAETLTRTVAARIAFAERAVAEHQSQLSGLRWQKGAGGEIARQSRLADGGDSYWLPFYDSSGDKPVPVEKPAVTATKTVRDLAIFSDLNEVFAAIKNYFADPSPQGNVRVGVYGVWANDRTPHIFYVSEVLADGAARISSFGFVGARVEGGVVKSTGRRVPLVLGQRYRLFPLAKPKMHEGIATHVGMSADPSGAEQVTFVNPATLGGKVIRFAVAFDEMEEIEVIGQKLPSTPLVGDISVLKSNPQLAEMYLVFLARFAGVKAERAQAKNGLTEAQVKAIIGSDAGAIAVTNYFTQGWKEYRRSGSDVVQFARLEETILIQWGYGNHMVLRNQLQIKSTAAEGLGIYDRGNGRKLYDENGWPLLGAAGNYRDPGFLTFKAPKDGGGITDPGLQLIARTLKNITVDQQVLIYRAAKGYMDNRDLLWPEVAKGWDRWAALEEELRQQFKVMISFLAAELVARLLIQFGDAAQKLIGAAIHILLKAAGYVFQIAFAAEALDQAYDCGRELSLLHREDGKPLDPLSQQHLIQAAVIMRRLVTMLVATGITVATMKAASAGAQSIEFKTPPGGGGLQPALATAGAGGKGAPGRPAGGAAAVAGGPPAGKPALPSFGPSPMHAEGRPEEGGGKAETKAQEKAQRGGKGETPAPEPTAEQKSVEAQIAQTQRGIDSNREFIKQIDSEIGAARKSSSPDKAKEIPDLARERNQRSQRVSDDIVKLKALEEDLAVLKKPLYEKVRSRTTGQMRPAAEAVLERARAKSGEYAGQKLDQASQKPAKSGVRQVDHLVSVFRACRMLFKMPGGERLSVDEVVAIIDQPKNLVAMDGAANNSKLERGWSDWPQWSNYYDNDFGIRTRMIALEEAALAAIEADFRAKIGEKGGK